MPKVNHENLRWARKSTALTQEEAARKLGIRDAYGMTAAERVAVLESGEAEPTNAMLFKMSRKYRVPSVVFFMNQDPFEAHRGDDSRTLTYEGGTKFAALLHGERAKPHAANASARANFRTLPHGERTKSDAILDTLYTRIWTSQSMVRDLREDEDAPPLPFIGSGRMESGRTAIVDLLRDCAEKAGVFVLLKGDLGSYHTAIGVDVFRGLAISDELAPYVVVNDKAPRSTWTLTLLRELARLVLGQTGLCNERVDNETERFCESVAVEFLLPALGSEFVEMDGPSEVKEIRGRLLSALPGYGRLRYGKIKRSKDASRIYYARLRYKLGNALVELIGHSLESGDLVPTRASRMLDVKVHQVYRVIDAPMPTVS